MHDRRGLLPHIGYVDHVAQHPIPVEAQQGIAVKQQRAHRADEHDIEANGVEQPRLAEPPQQCGHRSQHQLDADAGRSHGRTPPFARQHPGRGDIAVQTRREHQQHHAQLVYLAAKVLAGEGMSQLVHNFGQGHRQSDPQHVAGMKERVKLGQTCQQRVELHDHQRCRRRHQHHTRGEKRAGEHPAALGIEPVQNRLRVDARQANRQHVAQCTEPLAATLRAAPGEQLLALPWRIGHNQPVVV